MYPFFFINPLFAYHANAWLSSSSVATLVYFFGHVADNWIIMLGLLYLFFGSFQGERFAIDRIKQRTFETAQAMVTIGSLWFFAWIIKTITYIPRPYIALSGIIPLFTEPPGYDSFPSGHATLFFALATVIYMRHKKVGIIFYLLAFLIAISRVIAGVHYIGDIIAGAAIGILGTYCIGYLFAKVFAAFQAYRK